MFFDLKSHIVGLKGEIYRLTTQIYWFRKSYFYPVLDSKATARTRRRHAKKTNREHSHDSSGRFKKIRECVFMFQTRCLTIVYILKNTFDVIYVNRL